MKTRTHGLFILTMAVILLSGCAANIGVRGKNSLLAQDYPVELVPQGASGVLRIKTPNRGCTNNPHQGCIRFNENTVALMKFYLPGSRKKIQSCESGAKSVITGIQISATGSGEKGDFSVLPLPGWLEAEAFPLLNRNTGYVYDKNVGEGASQVWILNANAHDASLGARDFWYRVTVKSCGTPTETWVSDPRGENEGTWR